jgi:hypothetical protein
MISQFRQHLLLSSFIGLIILITIYQILIPPVVGLADNWDFHRVMGVYGISHIPTEFTDKFFRFFNLKYNISYQFDSDYFFSWFSSTNLITVPAILLNRIFSKDGLFDIRSLGILHALLVWIGLILILFSLRGSSKWKQIIIGSLLVFFFSDVGYVQYYNSFYSQTIALGAFFIIVGSVLQLITIEKNSSLKRWLPGLFCLGAILLLTAKPQHRPLGMLLLLWWIWFLYQRNLPWKPSLFAGRLVAILITASIIFSSLLKYPAGINTTIYFDSVFLGILPISSNPQEDLKALGFSNPEKYVLLTGLSASSEKSAEVYKNDPTLFSTLNKIGYSGIIKYYITHPVQIFKLLRSGAPNAFSLKSGFGNFTKDTGLPQYNQSQAFNFWSQLKERIGPRNSRQLALFFAINFLGIILAYSGILSKNVQMKQFAEFHFLLIVMAVSDYCIVMLANPIIDKARHLFLFNAICDLCIIGLIFYLVSALEKFYKYFQLKVRPIIRRS